MLPIGSVFDEIVEILYAKDSPDVKSRIWDQINFQYFELCREFSWAALRAPTALSLDFSSATSTGLLLPSDLLGIDMVWDSTNEQEFFEMDRPDSLSDESGYRYYRYLPSRSHLFEGSDLIVSKNGTSFTSAALTSAGSAAVGEYVQFGAELGIYKLTSATTPFTFTPTYRGENMNQDSVIVRPWQYTARMSLIDPSEDLLYDRTVSVYYWQAPPPLYRPQDVPLLPSLEVLKYRTLRALPESRGKFNVSESMLSESLRKATRLNAKFRRPTTARDKHNRRVDFSRNPYGTR